MSDSKLLDVIDKGDILHVSLLVHALANVDKHVLEGNFTLLGYAISVCNTEIAFMLMDSGACVNLSSLQEKNTPLIEACYESQLEIVKELIARGCNIQAKNIFGNTALHIASTPDIVQMLVAEGADVDARNAEGSTPLHVSLRKKRLDAFCTLLDLGANTKILDDTGKDIHFLSQYLDIDIQNILDSRNISSK